MAQRTGRSRVEKPTILRLSAAVERVSQAVRGVS
jgi:hypothetical protein